MNNDPQKPVELHYTRGDLDAAVSSALRGRDHAQNEAINMSLAASALSRENEALQRKIEALSERIEQLTKELGDHLPKPA